MTRRHLARRGIPVAIEAPVQLALGLRWQQPIERIERTTPDPEPVVARVRRAA